MNGPVDMVGLQGFLVFIVKRRGGVPSVPAMGPGWYKVHLYLLNFCAP